MHKKGRNRCYPGCTADAYGYCSQKGSSEKYSSYEDDLKNYHPEKYDSYIDNGSDDYQSYPEDYKPLFKDLKKPKSCHHPKPDCDTQSHVHEFAGSEMIAGKIPHNHRFAGVTSQAVKKGKSHIHYILVNDDFFVNHYHEVGVKTGPAVYVGCGKHVHLVKGETTINFGHHHDFIFTTFIENPLKKKHK